MQIYFSKKFDKKLAKMSKKDISRIGNRMELFKKNPKNKILKNHKLKGELNGKSSINITADIRAIYIQDKDEMIFIFLDLGTHSELYK